MKIFVIDNRIVHLKIVIKSHIIEIQNLGCEDIIKLLMKVCNISEINYSIKLRDIDELIFSIEVLDVENADLRE